MTWLIERCAGSAADFHARDLPGGDGAHVWVFEVDRPALALGSSQPESDVDAEACRRAGVEIVRRRSGGGAVLLVPGEIAWIDVIIPPGHRLWSDDVLRAGHWLGLLWIETLRTIAPTDLTGPVPSGRAAAVDVEEPLWAVHEGPMLTTAWSRRVCFDGLGPGEVVRAGAKAVGAKAVAAKAVGVSQRRTRRGARFQTAIHHRWNPEMMVGLLAAPPVAVPDLRPVVEIPATPAAIAAALVEQIERV